MLKATLTICMLGYFSCFCCRLLTFSHKKKSGTLSKCQTVWIHIRTEVFGPAKVINQQMTKITASKERVNYTVNPEILVNSIKRHTCDRKISQLGYDLTTSVFDSVILPFSEDFIFKKLRMRSFTKIKP